MLEPGPPQARVQEPQVGPPQARVQEPQVGPPQEPQVARLTTPLRRRRLLTRQRSLRP